MYRNYIEGNITLTTPELADLSTLTIPVDDVLPVKIWTLSLNDGTNATVGIALNGQIKTLRTIDLGASVVKLFLRIEGDEAVVVT